MAATRVLVVDDEATLRGVIRQVLEDDGLDVTEAGSAEQALQLFRDNPFPLVITDIIMGRMNGLELLEEIKKIDAEALVIVMTSHASLETATAALRSGAYDFLIKPFEEIDLISAVANRAVERVRLISDNRNLMQRLKTYAAELEQLNRRLKAMANRDGLTELYNRRYFNEALEMELDRSCRHERKFSLIFMDIDHFKDYNDTHGHLAGDEALKSVAAILRERSRKTTIAARYGGEEFVLLVPETDKDGAEHFAGLIRGIVEEHPFEGQEKQPLGNLTLSIGVATYPDDSKDAIGLLHCSDRALYQAKHNGRNTVVCWQASGFEQAESIDRPEQAEPAQRS